MGLVYEKALANSAVQGLKIFIGTAQTLGLVVKPVAAVGGAIARALFLPIYVVGCSVAIANEISKEVSPNSERKNATYAQQHVFPLLTAAPIPLPEEGKQQLREMKTNLHSSSLWY